MSVTENLNLSLAVPEHVCPLGVALRVIGTNDKPALNMADIARALAYKEPRHQVDKWRAKYGEPNLEYVPSQETKSPKGRGQPATFENWYAPEPIAYKIILTSGADNAEPPARLLP